MGTRGNVIIKESKNGPIYINMYHHMDSYISGLGSTLADFLLDRVLVNGITFTETTRISNGISDLAAQIVCLLKGSEENAGGVYIGRPRRYANDPNDYTYIIYPETITKEAEDWRTKEKFLYQNPTGVILIEVYNWKKRIFIGDSEEYFKFVQEQIQADA